MMLFIFLLVEFNILMTHTAPTETQGRDMDTLRTWGSLWLPVAAVEIGTTPMGKPRPRFSMIMDTGSDALWVTRIRAPNPAKKRTYDLSLSGTYQFVPYQLERLLGYGDGSTVRCKMAMERINLSGAALNKHGKVCLASEYTGHPSFDGIMGVSSPSSTDPLRNFPELLKDFKEKSISFYFNHSVSVTDAKIDTKATGEIALGGSNRALYSGDFTWVDVVPNPDMWVISLTSLSLNNKQILGPTQAAIDTGTPISLIPADAYEEVKKIVNPVFDQRMQINHIPCEQTSHLPTLTFMLGAQQLSIPPSLQFVEAAPGLCVYFINAAHDGRTLLGSTFLRPFYTSFDYGTATRQPRIGFARSFQIT